MNALLSSLGPATALSDDAQPRHDADATRLAAAWGVSVGGVRKRFDRTDVLRGVSFDIEQGQFVTLLGPSGCGKTTLLRIIAGLELADEGVIRIAGQAVDHLPANRRPVNTVFQSYALFPHLTVWENIAFGLRARRVEGTAMKKRVDEAMQMVQIEPLAQRLPAQLSGGQKQRVALARALVNEPQVLLLDEPMSALDAKLRASVQVELRRLQRKLGKTFILVTHDQDEAMTVSDRIIVMNDGVIEQAGEPDDVYERPTNRFVAEFLGSANLIAAKRNCHGVETDIGYIVPRHLPDWANGTIAIRPERIKVHVDQPPVNGIRAIVRDLIYRGDHMDVWCEPGPLRLRTAPSEGLRSGSEVWLELPQEHVAVLAD